MRACVFAVREGTRHVAHGPEVLRRIYGGEKRGGLAQGQLVHARGRRAYAQGATKLRIVDDVAALHGGRAEEC